MFHCEFVHDSEMIGLDAPTKQELAELVESYFGLFVYPVRCKVAFDDISGKEYVEAWPFGELHGLCSFEISKV